MRHPTQTEVSEHYQDYPYPAYEEKEENGDKNAFLIQTDCHRGDCHSIARNNTWLNYYMYTIALGPLNHYLYKVQDRFHRFSKYPNLFRAKKILKMISGFFFLEVGQATQLTI